MARWMRLPNFSRKDRVEGPVAPEVSEHERPGGSSLEGIPAVESERFMTSLRDACQECLPSLFRQHSP